MQQRGWIWAVGALLVIAVGLYIARSSGRTTSSEATPQVVAEATRPEIGVEVVGTSGGPATRSHSPHTSNDGGVARVAPRADRAVPNRAAPDRAPSGVPTSRGVPRDDPDADRSAGWHLGQARRRVAILRSRVEMYRGAVDRLVAEGRPEVAERQRAVLERVQNRVLEFEEQEAELLEQAQADGTMGEVDQGYEEGEQEDRRATTGSGVSPR